jgi:hypothetical protein
MRGKKGGDMDKKTTVAKGLHSIRSVEADWEKARRRTVADGTTMSSMLNELIIGYGRGLIDLPKTTVSYTKTKTLPPITTE